MCRFSRVHALLILGGSLVLAGVSCGLKTPLDSTPGESTGAAGSGGSLAAENSASLPDASSGPFRDTSAGSDLVVAISPDAKAGPDLAVAVLRDSAVADISPGVVSLPGPPIPIEPDASGPALPPRRDTADAGGFFPGVGVGRVEPDGGFAFRGDGGIVFRGDGGFSLPGGGGFALPGDGGFFVGGAGGAGRGGGAGTGAGRGGGAGAGRGGGAGLAGAGAGVGAGG